MKQKFILPFIVFFAFTAILFRPFFFQQLVPIPSDLIVGLFHPFRDLYSSEYPRGIPFKNPLIADPVSQQIVWRELSLSQLGKGQLPLWNPYQMAGYPLLGNIQSAPFYPLNLLFLIFPFITGWSFLIVSQIVLALTFMYMYLRKIKRTIEASILGSLAFAFSGFMISWLEWGTIGSTALWWPLALYGIELAKDKKRTLLSVSIVALSVVSSFLAGHTQTFFYGFLLFISYFAYSLLGMRVKKNFIIQIGASLLISLVLIFPIAYQQIQFVLLSARGIDLDWHAMGWFIPLQHLVQFIVPNFFGNPATGNYWGVWNYGEFIGYIGILPLLFAILAVVVRKDKIIWFFTAVIFTSLLLALPTPFAKLIYKFDIPFLSSSQPTRILFLIDISLAVLASYGLDYLKERKKSTFFSIGLLSIFLLFSFGLGYFLFSQGTIKNIDWAVTQRNLVIPFIVFFASTGGILIFYYAPKLIKRMIIPFLILLTFIDLLFVASKYNSFSKTEYFYPKTKVISYLQKNTGNQRIMLEDRRILHPNISTMYRLQMVDGYDPLYLFRFGELFAAAGRMKPDISQPFGFYRILTTEHVENPISNLLGVKYILSLRDIDSLYLKKVFQEGETRVYQNLRFLPRAFFVTKVTSVNRKEQAVEFLFKKDTSGEAVVENIPDLAKEYSPGNVEIKSYSPEKIMISTQNNGEGFLILTDTYYPTWKVTIDGKEAILYQADFTLRGVVVHKGEHEVVFTNTFFSYAN